MSLQYQFPEEIQSWIIGKRIPGDHESLAHCKIKGPGHSAYLYLRSPKSVGLTWDAYQRRRMAQQYPAGTVMSFCKFVEEVNMFCKGTTLDKRRSLDPC